MCASLGSGFNRFASKLFSIFNPGKALVIIIRIQSAKLPNLQLFPARQIINALKLEEYPGQIDDICIVEIRV
jgi:hypothetical protein